MVRYFLAVLALVLMVGQLKAADYKVDSGDTVQINVFNESDLSITTKINNSGHISYPFLGSLNVKNKTTLEIEDMLKSGLSDGYLIAPVINVSIVTYRDFFIRGQVKSPGGYAYQPHLTVLKAASLAGGFTGRANKDKIFIVRNGSASNLKKLVDLDTLIFPGDVLIIEESFF